MQMAIVSCVGSVPDSEKQDSQLCKLIVDGLENEAITQRQSVTVHHGGRSDEQLMCWIPGAGLSHRETSVQPSR